jgi:hypothetical protein
MGLRLESGRHFRGVVPAGHEKPTDQRILVRDAAELREQFANLQTGDVRPNRLKLPANLRRGLRLHIEHVDMTGAAGEVDEDDGLGGF